MVSVADEDTLTVLDSNHQQHRIGLGGIDAPEKGQPYGSRSKMNLSGLAFGKDARADCYKLVQYGRDVCTVFVHGKDARTLAQIEAGLAWWYSKYARAQHPRDRLEYEMAEDRAADRIGLWQDKNPVPPWKWRREQR